MIADIVPATPIDEQIAQMYELMQAIRERELAENDPEYKPHTPPTD